MSNLPQAGFMRLKAVLKIIPVGKSSWWNGVRSGRFPAPVRLGPNTTAWRVEDIQGLIESLGGGGPER